MPSRSSPLARIRYDAVWLIDARCAAGCATIAMPLSYGTFSHLCPSIVQESARSTPSSQCRRDGLTAAHSPNAPSTCSHAP